MGMTNTDSYYATAVEERYRVLRRALVVARSRPDWGLRLNQIAAIRAEIGALVRVRWFVRRQRMADRLRRAAVLTLPYHDWQALPELVGALTEPELFDGYGLHPEADSDALNREGDPAFNGAFSRW